MSLEMQSRDIPHQAVPLETEYSHWDDYAECKDVDIDKFEASALSDYTKLKVGEADRRKEVIAKYCVPCVVREKCLEEAIRYKDVDYIRGGLTPTERKKLIKNRNK